MFQCFVCILEANLYMCSKYKVSMFNPVANNAGQQRRTTDKACLYWLVEKPNEPKKIISI